MQWDSHSSGHQRTVTDLNWSSEYNLVLNINKKNVDHIRSVH